MRQKWASGAWDVWGQAASEARWTPEAREEQAEAMRQRWSDPQVRAELVRKVRQAWTAERVAEQAQRTKEMWTPERRAQWAEHMRAVKLAEAAADPRPARAVAMRREGVLIRDVASEFGVSTSTVARWIKRAKEAGEL